jgi:anti-anti-sigma factor
VSIQQVSAPLTSAPNDGSVLSLDLARCGPVTLVTISGEMDLSTAHLLTELVEHLARDHPAQVVLDMAQVSFFCAEGLRALLRARDTVTAAAGQLMLRAPSPRTWRVLTITRTEHLFPIDGSADTATGSP